MAKIRTLQLYRGTTAQNNAYTGSAGELTMDTTTNELRLHDGSTVGGHIIGSGGSGGAVNSVNGKTGVVVLTATDVGALPDSTVIPDAQIQSDWNQADNTKVDFIKNKPTIPAAQVNSDWNANSGVAQILNKPTIPTVNNPTITITQGGITKGSFTLNQATGDTIALDAGGGGGSSTLAGLSDVTLTSPTDGQVLTYDNGDWINTEIDCVVESQEPTAANGYTWYRKYKSGWVEQGGIAATTSGNPVSVTYPVVMSDSNYTLNVSAQSPQSTSTSTVHGCHYVAKGTTRCSIICLAGNSGNWVAGNISWQVSGMAA